MNTYLSLLKGVNVGGKRKISMPELVQEYEKTGFSSVVSYLNSGNILFQCGNTDKKQIAKNIKEHITDVFSVTTYVLVLDMQDMENILALCPWENVAEMNTSHVFINFLFDKTDTINTDLINKYKKDSEEIFYFNNAVFMHCPEGMADSKLTTNLFEKALGVNNTARNWNTFTKLLGKMQKM